jgi:hypothetical protein
MYKTLRASKRISWKSRRNGQRCPCAKRLVLKVCRVMEVKFHTFITSVLDGGYQFHAAVHFTSWYPG